MCTKCTFFANPLNIFNLRYLFAYQTRPKSKFLRQSKSFDEKLSKVPSNGIPLHVTESKGTMVHHSFNA